MLAALAVGKCVLEPVDALVGRVIIRGAELAGALLELSVLEVDFV